MYKCLNFKTVEGVLEAFFGNIPFKPVQNELWFAMLSGSSAPFDKFLNRIFLKINPRTAEFLESGELIFGYKIFRFDDMPDPGSLVDMFNKGDDMLLRIRKDTDLTIFINAFNRSDLEKEEDMIAIIDKLMENENYVFNSEAASAAAKREFGIDFDIPPSDVGLAPDYSSIADKTVNGKPVIFKVEGVQAITKIKYSSVRDIDFRLAYEKMGIPNNMIDVVKENYVWHHLDDFNPVTGEGTMQLVLKDVHNSAMLGRDLNHTGGVAIWKWFYGGLSYR